MIKSIKRERDYDRALAELEGLMGAEAGTEAGETLDALTKLIETYESRQWAIEVSRPGGRKQP